LTSQPDFFNPQRIKHTPPFEKIWLLASLHQTRPFIILWGDFGPLTFIAREMILFVAFGFSRDALRASKFSDSKD
jgi:hypothetical protein